MWIKQEEARPQMQYLTLESYDMNPSCKLPGGPCGEQ